MLGAVLVGAGGSASVAVEGHEVVCHMEGNGTAHAIPPSQTSAHDPKHFTDDPATSDYMIFATYPVTEDSWPELKAQLDAQCAAENPNNPDPAPDTATADGGACVNPGEETGVVTVTVTNGDDDTNETRTYDISFNGATVFRELTLADGETGSVQYGGLAPTGMDWYVSYQGQEVGSGIVQVTECGTEEPTEIPVPTVPVTDPCGPDNAVYGEVPAGDYTVTRNDDGSITLDANAGFVFPGEQTSVTLPAPTDSGEACEEPPFVCPDGSTPEDTSGNGEVGLEDCPVIVCTGDHCDPPPTQAKNVYKAMALRHDFARTPVRKEGALRATFRNVNDATDKAVYSRVRILRRGNVIARYSFGWVPDGSSESHIFKRLRYGTYKVQFLGAGGNVKATRWVTIRRR